jgi:uncharacterized protein (TIGR03067 family)
MRCASILVISFAVLATGVFAGAGDDANKADLKRLQGKWKVVSRQIDGQALKPIGAWTITGNKMLDGGGSGCYGVLKLNAKETPKILDIDQYDAAGKPFPSGTGHKGIFAFDGQDRLKWCVTGIADRPRPKAFESKQGDGNIYYVLERVEE